MSKDALLNPVVHLLGNTQDREDIDNKVIKSNENQKAAIAYARAMERKVKQKGHRADALALRAEERRDKLRKASGRSKYPVIRRCLNGETRLREPQSSIRESITYGREPGELKHLSTRRKRKKTRFPE